MELEEVQNQNVQNKQKLAEESDELVANSFAAESPSKYNLPDLFLVAKNISRSKGIYREAKENQEESDEEEIRRSILRKAIISTESDALKAVLNKFRTHGPKLDLLDHMEYLVHQFDVAVHFANMGGIKIISSSLFSPDDDIVSAVAMVLGAAMQSNPTVQKIAIKQNVGQNLLKLVSHESTVVLSRVIYALSSYLRNSPDALEDFIALNGVAKVVGILENPEMPIYIKVKVINIFSDLMQEYKAPQISTDAGSQSLRILARKFSRELLINGICKLIPSFLYLEDVTMNQRESEAVTSLNDACMTDFEGQEIAARLKNLINVYSSEAADPSVIDDVKTMLFSKLKDLLSDVGTKNRKEHAHSKDEL